jgi:hypothetical protein
MNDAVIKDLVVAQGVENPDAATLQDVKTRLEGGYIDDVLDGRFDAPAVQPAPAATPNLEINTVLKV